MRADLSLQKFFAGRPFRKRYNLRPKYPIFRRIPCPRTSRGWCNRECQGQYGPQMHVLTWLWKYRNHLQMTKNCKMRDLLTFQVCWLPDFSSFRNKRASMVQSTVHGKGDCRHRVKANKKWQLVNFCESDINTFFMYFRHVSIATLYRLLPNVPCCNFVLHFN